MKTSSIQKIFSIIMIALLMATTFILPASASQSSRPHADIITTNDNLFVVKYTGTWSYASGQAGYFNTDKHYSSFTDAYVELTFTGTEISLIAAKNTDLGKADVYIDTVLDETIDLYQATLSTQVVVYTKSDLTMGEHTIKVRVRGDKNTSSSGVTVNIDAFKYDDGHTGNELPPPTNEISCGTQPSGIVCTQIDSQHLTFVATNTRSEANNPIWVLGANGVGIIYSRLRNVSMHWYTGGGSGSGSMTFNFDVKGEFYGQNIANGPDLQTVGCGTYAPYSDGICTPADFYMEETVATAGTYSTAAQGHSQTFYPLWSEQTSYILEVSTIPFVDECTQRYLTLMTAGPFTIDPTIENPLGQEGVPPDEQIYPTVNSQYYAVRIAGGPWNDGTNDHYTVAYSWDGITWNNLDNGCVLIDPAQPYYITKYLQAESNTLYIRVYDSAGQFADNTQTEGSEMQYFVSLLAVIGNNDCTSQFAYDESLDIIASATIPADEAYTQVTDLLVPGDWYAIQIASGSWQDDGSPPDRLDAQYSFGNVVDQSAEDAIYKIISSSSTDPYCLTENGDGYITIYVQADNSPNLFMRVNDDAETWSINTGELDVNVYHATFTRTTQTCELRFGVGNFIGHTDISAQAENGVTVGIATSAGSIAHDIYLTPGAWYMLETTGGPWGWVGSLHNEMSYDVAIFWDGNWTTLGDWANAVCATQIDDLGHWRVFFQTPADSGDVLSPGAEYKIRVDDTSLWFNNVGSIGVDLYNAFDQQISLPNGSCDYIYDPDNPVGGASVIATHEDGDPLAGTLEPNSLYVIVIHDDQHWTETTGSGALYSAQISDDNGATWHDVPTGYGGVMCYFQVGNETTFFISTGAHYLYRMRVDSTTFTDNTGYLNVELFRANPGDTIDPWTTNCLSAFGVSDQLSLSPLDSFEWLDVHKAEGEPIITNVNYTEDTSIVGFVVEITNGPWHTNDATPDARYDAALSKDNGTTWQAIGRDNTDILCAVDDQLHLYWKAYFKVENGDVWKIRVNDEDAANWGNNSGNLAFKLYAVTGQAAPDCVIDTNRQDCLPPGVAIAINGQDACTMTIVMPTAPTVTDIPAWLDYLGGWVRYDVDIILQYMAWCPQHTNALMTLFDMLKEKEPFATLTEMEEIIKEAQRQIAAYDWSDADAPTSILGNQGGVPDKVMNKIFPPMNSKSPWAGGPLVKFNKYWSPTSYYVSCTSSFQDMLGPILNTAVCFASDEMRETGASFWIQLLLDVMIAFWALRQIWQGAIRLAHFMVGINYLPPSQPTINIDLSGGSEQPVTTGRSRRYWRRL